MPSMPLARNAIVGLPTASSASMRRASRSASPDSLSPHVRSTRLTMTDVSPERRRRSGRIASRRSPSSRTAPRAPRRAPCRRRGRPSPARCRAAGRRWPAPRGTSAWRMLLVAMRRPRAANIASIRAATSASSSRGTPITSAIASRVMSSWVGPSPPQTITASLRSSAAQRGDDAVEVVADLDLRCESMPASASCSPSHDEFVSTICPSSSSVPTATTSQRIAA